MRALVWLGLLFFWPLGCLPRNDPPQGPDPSSQHGYVYDLVFSHKAHSAHGGAPKSCNECHQQGRLRRPLMAACTQCHAKADRVGEANTMENCSLCHEEINKGTEPRWPFHYGKRSHRTYINKPVVYCAYCHSRDALVFPVKDRYQRDELCIGCHLSEGLGTPSLKD